MSAPHPVEELAERFLARVPGYVWDGQTLPVPVEEIADSVVGLLVRDVADLRTAPGAPVLDDDQSLSGLLLPDRGEIWVNAEESRRWPARRRFTIAHELGHWELHRDAPHAGVLPRRLDRGRSIGDTTTRASAARRGGQRLRGGGPHAGSAGPRPLCP